MAGGIPAQAPAPPPAPSAAELARAGNEALNRGQYTTAIYLLKQAVNLDGRHPSAWTALGRAYLALDQVDAAIDAHLKQIDVNPQCPGVYENLGLAYFRKEKRDEAIEAFKQQIDVDPQNAAAHTSLGSSYYDLQKYPDAITELEKAVSIRPEDNHARIVLGGAYLGAGQREKGLGLLDEAVQEKSSAAIWNDVAFKFAENKVQLGRAQQYAESAVITVSTQLRNVEADHITIATLRQVVSLAHYWDTLGWVHFQQGHPDEADRFLKAAWSLNPTGPADDHLRRLEGRSVEKPAAMKSVSAGKLLAEKAAAEFYAVQAPPPATAEVRFIRGDDGLRQFTNAIQTTVPAGVFPDSTPGKLVRRFTLICPGEGAPCTIELLAAPAAVATELNAIPPDPHFLDSIRSGVLRGGGGVTAPVPIYRQEPQYAEKARKAKVQGTVVLYVEVDPTGHAGNIKVMRSLGYGLDEKAIEAVSKWEFKPGMKEGKPVTVAATIQVNFRLLDNPNRY